MLGTGCLTQGASPTLEDRAQGIDRSLICPICPGETIDQSQTVLAKQMRTIVREKLAAGETRQDILDFFVGRYNEDVLAAPSKSGFNLVVWGIPVLGIAAAMAALALILRGMRRNTGGTGKSAGSTEVEAGLEPYVARVDLELEPSFLETTAPREGRRHRHNKRR
jgi:cytochrome c-type biogenesis protein CcmH